MRGTNEFISAHFWLRSFMDNGALLLLLLDSRYNGRVRYVRLLNVFSAYKRRCVVRLGALKRSDYIMTSWKIGIAS